MKAIDIDQLDALSKSCVIDIREVVEYEAGHIPYVIHIPKKQIESNPEVYLNKEETYYIVCQSGVRSKYLCEYLAPLGYKVVNVERGTGGYPKEKLVF